MKKYLILAASAAVVFGACSKNDVIPDTRDENAVTFGTYVPRAVSKAGSTNVLTNTELQSTGFGVFAYYTNNTTYDAAVTAGTATPNFMYNQEVTYASSAWSYTPVKYWPNQSGTGASSSAVDRLTFFAYAPYVAVGTTDTKGITGMTANTVNGDPKISYVCNPSAPVDLAWAVVPASTTWKEVEGTSTSLTAGTTYKDLIKPADAQKVSFFFKHALSKVKVTVKTDEKGAATHNIATVEDSGTRIFIRDLQINGASIYNAGTLNLNNATANTPKWEVTGTADGKIAIDITSYDKLYIAAKPTTWDAAWTLSDKPGVSGTAADLFSGMAIPTGDAKFENVVITYDVITKDGNLNGGVSVIENVITKSLTTAITLEAGKIYNFGLILGMESVDLVATTEDWVDVAETTISLPANV